LKVLFLGSTSFEGKPKSKGSRVIPLLKNRPYPRSEVTPTADIVFPPGNLWSDEPNLESDLHRDSDGKVVAITLDNYSRNVETINLQALGVPLLAT